MIDLQHINVKLLTERAEDIDLDPVIPIFHGWIQDQVFEELLIDVADYRHVPAGPGVVLIGSEADYSVDNNNNRLGIRYNRKAVLNSGNQSRLQQAARAALSACQRLEQDNKLNRKLNFNGRDMEVFINDRLIAPNTEATRQTVEPELRAFATKLFGSNEYDLSWETDPRRLLGASFKAHQPSKTGELLQNLGS